MLRSDPFALPRVFHGLDSVVEHSGPAERTLFQWQSTWRVAGKFRLGGTLFAGGEVVLAGYEMIDNPTQENITHQSFNIAFALAPAVFGPPGLVASGIYFGVDQTMGWGAVLGGPHGAPPGTPWQAGILFGAP